MDLNGGGHGTNLSESEVDMEANILGGGGFNLDPGPTLCDSSIPNFSVTIVSELVHYR